MALFLVTGGAGFIGSHLVTALAERGDRVRVLDDLSAGRRENLAHLEPGEPGSGKPVELFRADVNDLAAVRAACRGAAGIFHQAAQVSVPASIQDPERCYTINVMGTLRVLEAARAERVERLVFAASSAAYGDALELPKHEDLAPRPLSPYASSKLAGEALLAVWGRAYGLRTVSLRYFNIYGPRQADDSPYSGVIALFARALLDRRAPKIFGDGEQTRDFTYVSDAVQANLLAVGEDMEPGTVLNVGTGQRVTINELFSELARLSGFRGEPQREPARGGDVRHSQASIERARARLGYEPRVGLAEGLRRTLEWYRTRQG